MQYGNSEAVEAYARLLQQSDPEKYEKAGILFPEQPAGTSRISLAIWSGRYTGTTACAAGLGKKNVGGRPTILKRLPDAKVRRKPQLFAAQEEGDFVEACNSRVSRTRIP